MDAKKLLPIVVVILALSLLVYFLIALYPSPTDHSSPLWRNQQESASQITRDQYITLQADGMDASLSEAILSTNETGAWRNETETAFLWKQEAVFGFDNFGTATYKDSVLYAPSKGNNRVYAVNASDGTVIWSEPVRQLDASPYIEEDVIYIGECIGPYDERTPYPRAMALNRTNGETIWSFTEPGNFEWVGSPLVNGDYVYYTTYGSGVYALNKTNGNTIWHSPDIGTIVCSVAYDNGVVFVSAYTPAGQYALNATTGETIWQQNYGQSWDSSPIVYDGKIMQVTSNGTTGVWSTYVLNETNGQLVRKFEDKGSTATPLVHDGKVFIPSSDWRMWAYNLETGEELWRTVYLHNGTLQDFSYSSPALSGGGIYFQSLNGTFYLLNETDGNVLWSYNIGGLGFGSPSVGDGLVFITNDYALHAFKIGPGDGDWPMFCSNNFHQSYSENGVDYIKWPLTEPRQFKGTPSWTTAKFVWRNETIDSTAIAWRIYFFDTAGNSNVTDVQVFNVGTPRDIISAADVIQKSVSMRQRLEESRSPPL